MKKKNKVTDKYDFRSYVFRRDFAVAIWEFLCRHNFMSHV